MRKTAKRKKIRDVKASAVNQRDRGRKRRKKPTNLSLDPDAVARGEKFGKRVGTSLSQLVTRFLFSLPTEPESRIVPLSELTPAVRRLYGVAAGEAIDRESYRDYLSEKYEAR
jgi:Family of unknown function (DUF6364)